MGRGSSKSGGSSGAKSYSSYKDFRTMGSQGDQITAKVAPNGKNIVAVDEVGWKGSGLYGVYSGDKSRGLVSHVGKNTESRPEAEKRAADLLRRYK